MLKRGFRNMTLFQLANFHVFMLELFGFCCKSRACAKIVATHAKHFERLALRQLRVQRRDFGAESAYPETPVALI